MEWIVMLLAVLNINTILLIGAVNKNRRNDKSK